MKGCGSLLVSMAFSLEGAPSIPFSSSNGSTNVTSTIVHIPRVLRKRILHRKGLVLHNNATRRLGPQFMVSAIPEELRELEFATKVDEEEESDVQVRDKTPEEIQEAEECIDQILRVVEILREKRDMTPNEVRLTVMIEDPRIAEYEESYIPRDDLAAAMQDIIDGKTPNDMDALRALRDELIAWPNLDDMIEKKDPSQSPYAQITDTGVVSTNAAEPASSDWDKAADFTPGQQKELGDILPPVVGYSFLYLLTFVPIIIGVTVVTILYINSFQ